VSTRARETESTTADDGFHAGSGGEGAAAKDKTRPATPDSTRGGEPDTMGRWFMATILFWRGGTDTRRSMRCGLFVGERV